ncbi:MAG: type II toxin-antitoxin system RelE/ParE family toxin [Candidatus Aenigmarchaeota archaeon]|nr:type II toxin-antitoxin system RelE/ParE family toxin [Candidatus Aenigmarchaeota archaeon]
MFEVRYSNQAAKFLRKADKSLVKRITTKVEEIKADPSMIRDSKVLEGYKEKLFRIRVGDYRILYEIDYDNKIIGIVKIDRRERVY